MFSNCIIISIDNQDSNISQQVDDLFQVAAPKIEKSDDYSLPLKQVIDELRDILTNKQWNPWIYNLQEHLWPDFRPHHVACLRKNQWNLE